jgi:hypothetical protein
LKTKADGQKRKICRHIFRLSNHFVFKETNKPWRMTKKLDRDF